YDDSNGNEVYDENDREDEAKGFIPFQRVGRSVVCRRASYKVIATVLERLRLRTFGLTIGTFTQRSQLSRSRLSGRPRVSGPKTKQSLRLNDCSQRMRSAFVEKKRKRV